MGLQREGCRTAQASVSSGPGREQPVAASTGRTFGMLGAALMKVAWRRRSAALD